MKSNMRSLIKKSLFFIVLSIVYNPTFSADSHRFSRNVRRYEDIPGSSGSGSGYEDIPGSSGSGSGYDRIDECKANVHLVFSEILEPYFSFKFAMFSLSVPAIESMRNLADLLSHFESHEITFCLYERAFNLRHQDIKHYINMLVTQIKEQDNISLESKRKDIAGYFKHLISQFGMISQRLKKYVTTPNAYCRNEVGRDELICRVALSIMLNKPIDDVKNIEGDEAFVSGYLNRNFLDFANNNIFSASASSSAIIVEDSELQKFQLDSTLFPTVEHYCRGPGQTIT